MSSISIYSNEFLFLQARQVFHYYPLPNSHPPHFPKKKPASVSKGVIKNAMLSHKQYA